MQQTQKIAAAGITFRAQQTSEQPRAVFLHGFGGDLHTWDLLWPEVANNLSALRYDLRGFGQSIDRRASPFRHADDLVAILNAIHIDKIDIIGISMGGAVALNFALEYPERVRNLILISPGIVAWEWSDSWRALWRAITTKARAGDMDAARQLWWQHPLFETARANAIAAPQLFESIQRFAGTQWIRNYEKESLPDVERLYMLKARTLLLTGARDFEDFRLIADLIEASAPNITRVDWPDHGHLLNLENPSRCAREIISFLESSSHAND